MNLNDLVKKNRWAEIAEVLQLVSFENEHERSGPAELMMMGRGRKKKKNATPFACHLAEGTSSSVCILALKK